MQAAMVSCMEAHKDDLSMRWDRKMPDELPTFDYFDFCLHSLLSLCSQPQESRSRLASFSSARLTQLRNKRPGLFLSACHSSLLR